MLPGCKCRNSPTKPTEISRNTRLTLPGISPTEDLLRWGRYCTHIGFPDRFTQRILAQEKVGFAGSLFSSEHNQTFSTEGSYAKLERDPKEKYRFILTIDGINVFQWFRDMARKLLEKLGFQPKEPRQSRGRSI